MAEAFRRRGYCVAINDPYAGQELLRRFGAPSRGHESLQIEINRAIYLNEQTREPLPHANRVRADITDLLSREASDRALRMQHRPTLPSTLALEKATTKPTAKNTTAQKTSRGVSIGASSDPKTRAAAGLNDAAKVSALLERRLPPDVPGRELLWMINNAWAHIT